MRPSVCDSGRRDRRHNSVEHRQEREPNPHRHNPQKWVSVLVRSLCQVLGNSAKRMLASFCLNFLFFAHLQLLSLFQSLDPNFSVKLTVEYDRLRVHPVCNLLTCGTM